MTTHRIDTAGRPATAGPQVALPISLTISLMIVLRVVLTMLLLTGALSMATAASSTPAPSAAAKLSLPAGLEERDWQAIRARIVAHRQAEAFEAMPDASASAHTADNTVHGFAIRYGADGATELTLTDRVTAKATAHRITLQPVALGYGARLTPLSGPLERKADGVRVDTVWNRELREWWVNEADGLEQWFELAAPPAGRGDDGASAEPLRLEMALHSSLDPVLVGSGPAQHLSLSDGTTHVRFEKLQVEDSTGRRLPAEMELDRQPDADRLAYVIDDRDAVYPLTIDPTFVQQAYLKASNTGENDAFGHSIAISDDTLVVGAFIESSSASGVDGNENDDSATASGAAYVFIRNGESWSQQAYLKASNAELGDQFGWSVAISGDTIVVGANAESSSARGIDGDQNDNSAPASGAVYVFVRNGTTWTQQAYLKASNTDPLDRFGHSVAISGDTLVVGAPFEDSPFLRPDITNNLHDAQRNESPDHDAGAVYVFVRNDGAWAQQVYLKPSWNTRDDQFGHSVAISGDTVVVGSPNEDSSGTIVEPGNGDSVPPGLDSWQFDDSAPEAGAVWVFVHDPEFWRWNGWKPQAYVKASNTDAGDEFGSAIAISGDTIVIGAQGEDSNATGVDGDQNDNSAAGSGAAYVFQRSETGDETTWQQQAYLKASNPNADDRFGTSLALSGDTLVIGAERDDSNATGVNGDQNDNSTTDSGAAHLFLRSGGLWQQQAYLKASNTDAFDAFGFAVAVSGTTVVVGAPAEGSNATGVDGDQDDNSAAFSGAVYGFDLATFSISGDVSGLAGSGLLLHNNGEDPLAIAANGAFTFDRALADGSDYDVTVARQPSGPNQFCAVTNGSGTLSGADINNVAIECVAAFTVGGSVGELALPGLVLGLNGDSLLLFDRGVSFTFPDTLPEGAAYLVEVLVAPAAHDCTVANASGTIGNDDIDNVQVTCTTDIEFADSFESLETAPVEL